MTNAVNLSSVAGTGFLRNRIINGDMRIDQRNAGASVTPTSDGVYTLDRWQVSLSAASKFSLQQSSNAPSNFTNSVIITSLSSYSIGASDYFMFNQPIEGFNMSDFGWGTASAQSVTLSFWVRSSLTGTFGGAIQNASQARSYPFSYTISSANTWEQKSITIPGDTTGTWLTTNLVGLYLRFAFGVGSTFSASAGAWAAGQYFAPTGATSVVGTNGATFYLTGVQFEVGTVATPFERRQFTTEIQLCQRYFSKSYSLGTAVGTGTTTGTNQIEIPTAAAIGPILGTVRFPVLMRTSPSIGVYNDVGSSGNVTTNAGNTNTPNVQNIGEGSVTIGASATNWVRYQWTASAEL